MRSGANTVAELNHAVCTRVTSTAVPTSMGRRLVRACGAGRGRGRVAGAACVGVRVGVGTGAGCWVG
eukprot:7323439-Prymnesium_polylepis.1